MSLDKNDVRRVAFLARIRVNEDDLEPVAQDLNNIIGWVEQLAEVDTDGVEPLAHPLDVTQPMREDKVTEVDRREELQTLAPETEDGLYLVPKVIE